MMLFDGAMGTLYVQRYPDGSSVEEASVLYPERIAAIHKEYIDAGADAILTNTFHTQNPKTIQAACQIAREQAKLAFEQDGKEITVFADLGPESNPEIYKQKAALFLEAGLDHFLFETLSSLEGVIETAKWIKEQNPNAYIIASFAIAQDGYSRAGIRLESLASQANAAESIDVIGLNCICGPSSMRYLRRRLKTHKPVLIRPNAGMGMVVERHTTFKNAPEYFASLMMEMEADMMGGCCGTTPEHIKALSNAASSSVTGHKEKDTNARAMETVVSHPAQSTEDPIRRHKIMVEVDPPGNDEISTFLECCWRMKKAGADVITIADSPAGRPRADSSMLAARIHRELDMEVLPHITCRDRNRTAIKALLLGLSMEDVHQVLIVTGDPVPQEDRTEVRQVYNFNSRKLAGYISSLKEEGLCQKLKVYGALNINAPNFEVQLNLAKEKQENGMSGLLTQPILSARAMENFKAAQKELDLELMAGIYPLVSYNNALFMDNEIPGVSVDPNLLEAYKGLDRGQAEELAYQTSVQIMDHLFGKTDGFYLMMPFTRMDLMERLIRYIRNREKVES